MIRKHAGWCLVVVIACGPSDQGPTEFVLNSGVETVIDGSDSVLGSATRLSVGPMGRLYIVDQRLSQIVAVDSGGHSAVLGREGEGPGELKRPVAVRVTGDTVRVLDAGNGRVQLWDISGRYLAGRRLEANARSAMASLRDDGWLAIPTMGLGSDSLIMLLDARGVETGRIGQLPGGPMAGIDMESMKAAIRDRKIPALNRNFARPVFSNQGGLWVVLLAEAQVRRYGSAGELQWTADVAGPAIDEIREGFFTRNNEEGSPFSFYPLAFAVDAIDVGGTLWLLLNWPYETRSAEIWVMDGVGTIRCQLRIPDATGAGSIAVDPDRQILYVGISSAATVLRVPLPAGQIDQCA